MKDGNEAEVAKNNVKENPDFDLQLILSSPIPLDTNENISVKSSAGSIIEWIFCGMKVHLPRPGFSP